MFVCLFGMPLQQILIFLKYLCFSNFCVSIKYGFLNVFWFEINMNCFKLGTFYSILTIVHMWLYVLLFIHYYYYHHHFFQIISISASSFLILLILSAIVFIILIYTLVHIKYYWTLIIWHSHINLRLEQFLKWTRGGFSVCHVIRIN